MRLGIRRTLENLFRQDGIQIDKIIILGSFAHGKQRQDSDIDIIIVSKKYGEMIRGQ